MGSAVRFAYLADTHYHAAAPRDFGAPKLLTRGREVLDATAPAVNAVAPDFVVHGGDLLCGGGSFEIPPDQYLQSIREVASAYEQFSAPFHMVPGNHDCDAVEFSFAELGRHFAVPQVLDVVEPASGLGLALANVYHEDCRDGVGAWTPELDQELRRADAAACRDGRVLLLILHPWILPGYPDQGGIIDGWSHALLAVSECPSVAAVLTGHRHRNRVRPWRDFLIVDTACLIGFPVGFRELVLDGDGLLTCRFHQLDLPDFIETSRALSSPEANDEYQGEITDRDFEVLLPRVRSLWCG